MNLTLPNILHLCCILSAITISSAVMSGAEKSKPNFVFFLVDDLGWADVGCFGSTFHETPNIDALSASGTKFTNGYAACPVCSPTRASILTGRHPVRDGDWKLIEFYHFGEVELYNLKDDPGEQRELSKENPEKTEQLLAQLHRWQKQVGAKMPRPVETEN